MKNRVKVIDIQIVTFTIVVYVVDPSVKCELITQLNFLFKINFCNLVEFFNEFSTHYSISLGPNVMKSHA